MNLEQLSNQLNQKRRELRVSQNKLSEYKSVSMQLTKIVDKLNDCISNLNDAEKHIKMGYGMISNNAVDMNNSIRGKVIDIKNYISTTVQTAVKNKITEVQNKINTLQNEINVLISQINSM